MTIEVIKGDCLEKMKDLDNGSVDLILTDPPYGTMNGAELDGWEGNKTHWDNIIDTKKMFVECERTLRENGILVLFSQEPYTSKLITESHGNLPFLYRMIWLKDHFANALIAKVAPVSYFEDILIFSKKYDTLNLNPLRDYAKQLFGYLGLTKKRIFSDIGNQSICHFMRLDSMQFSICTEETYNWLIKFYHINEWDGFKTYKEMKELNQKSQKIFNLQKGEAKKSNVLKFKKDYQGLHPTQKPVALLKDLIQTYSNEGDLVLDFTAGSFSTLVACQETNRNGIGIELDEKFCEIGRQRLKQTSLFHGKVMK